MSNLLGENLSGFEKFHRLDGEKLKYAKEAFQEINTHVIFRPWRSCRASPFHKVTSGHQFVNFNNNQPKCFLKELI